MAWMTKWEFWILRAHSALIKVYTVSIFYYDEGVANKHCFWYLFGVNKYIFTQPNKIVFIGVKR